MTDTRIVHMTSLIKRGCERQTAYQYSGVGKVPTRWAGMRGTITHRAIEIVLLSHDEVNVEEAVEMAVEEQSGWPGLPNITPSHIREMETMTQKALDFLDSHGFREHVTEDGVERTETHEDGNLVLTGTMDLYLPQVRTLVDWKTGKGTRKNHAHFTQLHGYNLLLGLNGKIPAEDLMVVYLGNDMDEPAIVRVAEGKPMTETDLTSLMMAEEQFIDQAVEKPLAETDCNETYLCNYCGFRHICLGI